MRRRRSNSGALLATRAVFRLAVAARGLRHRRDRGDERGPGADPLARFRRTRSCISESGDGPAGAHRPTGCRGAGGPRTCRHRRRGLRGAPAAGHAARRALRLASRRRPLRRRVSACASRKRRAEMHSRASARPSQPPRRLASPCCSRPDGPTTPPIPTSCSCSARCRRRWSSVTSRSATPCCRVTTCSTCTGRNTCCGTTHGWARLAKQVCMFLVLMRLWADADTGGAHAAQSASARGRRPPRARCCWRGSIV